MSESEYSSIHIQSYFEPDEDETTILLQESAELESATQAEEIKENEDEEIKNKEDE